MRRVHQLPELYKIMPPQRFDSFQYPRILSYDVASPFEFFAGEPVQVLYLGIAQLLDAQCAGCLFARLSTGVVARRAQFPGNLGVADEEGEPGLGQV